MRKIIALCISLSLMMTALVGCGGSTSSSTTAATTAAAAEAETTAVVEEPTATEPYKIGVATIHEGESWEVQKKYFEEEVGPALNMEFVFSERVTDAAGLIQFMETAYAAGCVGILSMVTSNDAVAQGAQRAEEWGIWFVTQNSARNDEVATLSYNLGHCGASATGVGDAYAKAFAELLGDGEDHSIFVFAGAAVGGAIGQGAASHYYSVQGILEAAQAQYGLTYANSMEDMINNQNPGEVALSGNDNVKIYLYPGLDVAAATTAAQTQFQNGGYDIFAAVFSYSQFTNVLSDVEQSQSRDIKVVATAPIEAQTLTGFTTQDSQGNGILNAAVINPLNTQNAICSVLLYNALTGHADAMKNGGETILFKVDPWVCMDAETYEGISQLDTSSETYVMNADDLHELCVDRNPDVTYEDIEAKLAELTDIDAIIADKLQ